MHERLSEAEDNMENHPEDMSEEQVPVSAVAIPVKITVRTRLGLPEDGTS